MPDEKQATYRMLMLCLSARAKTMKNAQRDRVLLSVALNTGLRIGDILRLTVGEVTPDKPHTFITQQQKTPKDEPQPRRRPPPGPRRRSRRPRHHLPHNGTHYLFFGRRFGRLEGLVLVTDPWSDTIITAYRNRDFPRWIKSRIKTNNPHSTDQRI